MKKLIPFLLATLAMPMMAMAKGPVPMSTLPKHAPITYMGSWPSRSCVNVDMRLMDITNGVLTKSIIKDFDRVAPMVGTDLLDPRNFHRLQTEEAASAQARCTLTSMGMEELFGFAGSGWRYGVTGTGQYPEPPTRSVETFAGSSSSSSSTSSSSSSSSSTRPCRSGRFCHR